MSTGVAQQPTAVVEGIVTNKLTGTPLKSAHVIYTRLETASEPAASPVSRDTDAQGQFHLDLIPGAYRVWVERSGFARQHYGARAADETGSVLKVAAGQHLRDLSLRMTPLSAISGRITDEDGEALQGAGIQVLRVSYVNGNRELVAITGASSDDRGEYRCYELPAGRYFVRAAPSASPLSHAADEGALLPEVQDAYVPVFYPGVLDVNSASTVSVGEGADLGGIDFQISKVRAATIRGQLQSPWKFANSQVQVVLAPLVHDSASFIGRVSAAVDTATGRFEIRGVAPGAYVLAASQAANRDVLSARVPVNVVAGVPPEEQRLSLAPSFEVHGSVVMEDGSALPPHLTLRLQPSEGLVPATAAMSEVGADGSVRFGGMYAGNWRLSPERMPEGLWIKSVTLAGRQTDGELPVSAGNRAQLRVVLGSNGAQISGIVEDKGQPEHATVVLAPADPELQNSPLEYHSASTNDRGMFVFKGVRPGEYRIFAFEHIAPFSWLDPDVLNTVQNMGEQLSLARGESASRQLAPIPYESLLPSR